MYKLLPDSLYNVPAIESWLEDMARKGWRCVNFPGEGWVKFERSAPEACRYRLEPQLQDGDPDPERKGLYGEMGWEFVSATRREEFYLWRSARPDAREIHTDPVAQDIAFSWVSSILRHQLLLGALLDGLLLLVMAWGVWRSGWVLPTARRGIGTIPANLFIILWCNGQLYFDWKALGRLRQSLAAGIPMEHRGPYGARLRAQRFYILIALSLLAVSLVEDFGDQKYFRELPAEVPAVALEDLGAKDIRYQDGMGEALLLDDRMVIWQRGMEGRSETEVFDLRLPALSGVLLHDLAVHEVRKETGRLPEPLADTRFDDLRYARGSDGMQHLLARRGGRVLYMTAEVPETLTDHLDALDEALSRPMGKGDA